MKNCRAGWQGSNVIYEYCLYNSENETKTTVRGTVQDIIAVSECFNMQPIAPSRVGNKVHYRDVDKTEFLKL